MEPTETLAAPPRRSNALIALFSARALRDFGDGFVAVLLPSYLIRLGFSTAAIGILAGVALLGSATLALGAGFLGGRFDYRRLLLASAFLMAATGSALAAFDAYAVLLAIAFIGTVNPSGGSASAIVPIEHAVVAREANAADRTRAFARYSLVGALAGSVGALASGAPDLLKWTGLSELGAMRAMFALYAVLGLGGALFYARVPARPPVAAEKGAAALGLSRGIVYRLAALFSLDAFAGGFVVQSLLALWLFQKFDLSLAAAGVFFFLSGILSAFSFPVAARLADRFGLINTMVFTHIPSSLCLIGAAFASSLNVTLALLLIRAALSQMDVPTRSSYVMAVVTEPERPAAASFTSVPRSLAASLSPGLAGALFAAGGGAAPLVLCGALKIAYDLLLLRQFRALKAPEEG
ncbi:MFS transporter [Rhodoblastus sp.]|uniref:MFS transporter n=1 Tax=Rhodoblastus sp. TaxID=1962975 RepID=UPI0035B4D9EB